jgi:hypothetical protein
VRWGYNPVCKRWIENKRKKEKEKQGKGRRKRIEKKQDRRNREIARGNKGMNYIRSHESSVGKRDRKRQ